MANRISQREAQRLRKRVFALENIERERYRAWTREYPGGTHIDTIDLNDTEEAILSTARKLGFTLIAKLDGKAVMIYAVKP